MMIFLGRRRVCPHEANKLQKWASIIKSFGREFIGGRIQFYSSAKSILLAVGVPSVIYNDKVFLFL